MAQLTINLTYRSNHSKVTKQRKRPLTLINVASIEPQRMPFVIVTRNVEDRTI